MTKREDEEKKGGEEKKKKFKEPERKVLVGKKLN